jgi:hypothetical protein
MKIETNMRKIKAGTAVVAVCLVMPFAAMFLFASNPDKDSEKIIPQSVEKRLKKDSNGLSNVNIAGKEAQKWSWINPDDKIKVTWTAEQAFKDAKNYVVGYKPRQLEALKMYQRVLDANPSRLLELHVKLSMGSRMMILYNLGLGETDMHDEALKWYELLVHDFNDLGNHTDMMTAKIHLGDIYCWSNYGINELKKASDLCLQVINVPEKDIIFDNESEVRFNLENINIAQAPGGRPGTQRSETTNQKYRQRLLEQRQKVINENRLVAIQSLIRKQYVPGFPQEVFLERLKLLKQERPDDKLYQETLEAKIQDYNKILESSHSVFQGLLKEGLKDSNLP